MNYRAKPQLDAALLDVLARTIQVEAAFGPARGFDAVGAVIANRAKRLEVPSLEFVCRTFPCWIARADGTVPALAAPAKGRSYEQSRRVARQILRGRHVDPTAGAVEWRELEEGPPPKDCRRVRVGGRWYFDPQTERRRK